MKGLAVIGRADDSGLGEMTVEFCRHMDPEMILVWWADSRGQTRMERLPPGAKRRLIDPRQAVNEETFEEALAGMRCVVAFETFYHTAALNVAARIGAKTVLFPMWECTPGWSEPVDVLICLSQEDMKHYPTGVRAHWPISRLKFPPKRCEVPPRRFVHNAGSFGYYGRNGTKAVLTASLKVNDVAEIIVRCQEPIPADVACEHKAKILRGSFDGRYDDADVFVFPMRFPGLSLPLLEAASMRIPTLVLDLPEWSDYPEVMRIPSCGVDGFRIGYRPVTYHRPDVEALAYKIRALATGAVRPELPPEPNTWEAFREWFAGRVYDG